jgi:hypothetical protein
MYRFNKTKISPGYLLHLLNTKLELFSQFIHRMSRKTIRAEDLMTKSLFYEIIMSLVITQSVIRTKKIIDFCFSKNTYELLITFLRCAVEMSKNNH